MSIPHFKTSEEKNNCCGCRACGYICPTKSIRFDKDDEGFFYPVIDVDTCTDCGLCEKVCPNINLQKISSEQHIYAAWAKDDIVRNDASSGGIFPLLAMKMLDKEGVVYGAAFDQKLILKHIGVSRLEDLKPLCKSKYLQSDTNESFLKVKDDLENNRNVLFVGTPCQVAALKNYLAKKYNNLLTADFICHGVPSQEMFDRCLQYEEEKEKGKIHNYSFRVKDGRVKHVHGYSYTIQRENKLSDKKGIFYENPFYFGFKKYLFLRRSCYHCKYATTNRPSDITLADFWGIEDHMKKANFTKGVSMVITNSSKGQQAFKEIIEKISYRSFDMQIAIKGNYSLNQATQLMQERNKFFEDLQQLPFEKIVNQYLTPKRMIVYKLFYLLPAFVRGKLVKLLGVSSYD
jgi:coenzyme F420-reducing hydrogenase beta subunit